MLKPPRSLGRVLNFAAGAVNKLGNERLAKHDLTLPQWVVLSALWREEELSVSQIAEYAGVNAPAASRILDRMEARGLINREMDAEDRRSMKVRCTELGRKHEALALFYEDINAAALEGFSEAEALALFGFLARVEKNLSRHAE